MHNTQLKQGVNEMQNLSRRSFFRLMPRYKIGSLV
jgi:hypothetical protein